MSLHLDRTDWSGFSKLLSYTKWSHDRLNLSEESSLSSSLRAVYIGGAVGCTCYSWGEYAICTCIRV